MSNNINPMSDSDSKDTLSMGRSMGGNGSLGEFFGLGWREILALVNSYAYLTEDQRNELRKHGIAAFDHRIVGTG